MYYYEYDYDKIDVVDKLMSFISTRQYENALECIGNLDLSQCSDPLILMSKAQCFLRLGKKEEAYDIYRQTIKSCDEKLKKAEEAITKLVKDNGDVVDFQVEE